MRKLALTLSVVLIFGTVHCDEDDAVSPLPRCDANADCDVPLSTTGLRRLSAREYRNAIRDLVGMDTDPSVDADRGRFDNGPRDVWVTAELAEDYERLAWQVAAEATTRHRMELVGACTQNCFDAYVSTFARRAFRRLLTSVEIARLRSVWTSSGPDEAASLEATCAATLNSPAFLYREELGVKNDHGTVTLSDDELASALSFFIIGSIPDAELLRAAAAKELARPGGLEAQARRLLGTERAKAQFETFLDQWFATDALDLRTKDPETYPGFDERYRGELHRDVRAFYRISLDAGASARSLLSSTVSFSAETRQKYATARVGILEHPAFLASHGGYDASGPISRGVFALGSLFCAPPSPPPAGIARRPPEPTTSVTTRERYQAHVTQPLCQACHTAIDGVGFGFEGFDGTGQARTEERGRPIDASGLLFLPGRASVRFEGTRDLGTRALTLPDVAMCYSVHLTRFSMGTGESERDTKYARALSGAATVDDPLSELVLRITRTRAFRERQRQVVP